MLWLSKAHREYLDEPYTLEDITQVINSLPNDKAPGLDGLPASFYKTYCGILAPGLLDVYQESMETGALLPSMREAVILTLLKPDKDPASRDSYRPLSLINQDNKILAKLIAQRLQPFLPLIAKPDQSGFIPGRSTAHNLRTFFALLHYLHPQTPAVAVLLDATKAFDTLEWPYLFAVLAKLGLSPTFMAQIRLLYAKPTARLRLNGLLSESFPVTRGTRQVCPLSRSSLP